MKLNAKQVFFIWLFFLACLCFMLTTEDEKVIRSTVTILCKEFDRLLKFAWDRRGGCEPYYFQTERCIFEGCEVVEFRPEEVFDMDDIIME